MIQLTASPFVSNVLWFILIICPNCFNWTVFIARVRWQRGSNWSREVHLQVIARNALLVSSRWLPSELSRPSSVASSGDFVP